MQVLWNSLTAAMGAIMGLAPHVLHHVGFLVGAAAVTGVAGNLLFGVLGLALSVPFLLKLRRRFGNWQAPGIALGLFIVMFSLSAFVIGPAISGGTQPVTPTPTPTPTPTGEHEQHEQHN